MKGGIVGWLIAELAIFSVAIYALRNPDRTGAFISASGTGIAGVTRAFQGKVSG